MEGVVSQSQAVLPLQFYGPRRGTLESEPRRRLMSTMRFAVSRPSSKGINWGGARNLQKSNRGSSLAGMTGRSRFERYVVSRRFIRKLFDKVSPAGQRKESPAGNHQ